MLTNLSLNLRLIVAGCIYLMISSDRMSGPIPTSIAGASRSQHVTRVVAVNDATYSLRTTLRAKGPLYATAWSPDETYLAVIEAPFLKIFDTKDWRLVFSKEVLSRLYTGSGVAFVDNDTLVIGVAGELARNGPHNEEALSFIDVHSLEIEGGMGTGLDNEYPQDSFALSNDRSTLIAWSVASDSLSIYDMKTKSMRATLRFPDVDSYRPYRDASAVTHRVPDQVRAASISHDGQLIAVCSVSGHLYVYERPTLTMRYAVQASSSGMSSTACSINDDATLIAVATDEKAPGSVSIPTRNGASLADGNGMFSTVKVFDAHTGVLDSSFENRGWPINSLDWPSDCDVLAVGQSSELKILQRQARDPTLRMVQSFDKMANRLAISRTHAIAAISNASVLIFSEQ